MTDLQTKLEIFDAVEHRRRERRQFLRYAGGATAAVGGLALLSACGDDTPAPTPTPTPTTSAAAQQDIDVLNFALNLEYLEAQFYSYAAFGVGLDTSILSGVGTQGAVTGGAAVPFQDTVVAQYAREIALDEIAHVKFLRSALGSAAVAQPALNISGGTVAAPGAFTAAARAAGVVTAQQIFDPYASDNAFLLGAFIFEDVGVTAYKGASPLISNATYLSAAAGILAVEAYHAGLVRTVLYAKGIDPTNGLRTNAGLISAARNSLDGTADVAGSGVGTGTATVANDDQGITGPNATTSNIVPTDANGLAYSRTAAHVLNIVYLSASPVSAGGFFPAGVNGNIRTSGS